jgi:hypothetical protein
VRRLLAQRQHQPQIIKGWRAQVIDDASDVGDRGLGMESQLLEQPVGCIDVVPKQLARCRT